MGATKIEWADYTFNPWRGCAKVSAGCANCYAERESHRNPAVLGYWGSNAPRAMAAEAYWAQPIRWNEQAAKDGIRRRVFVGSLMDVFEPRRELNKPRIRLWALIRRLDMLDWLLLTKRPEHWRHYWPMVHVPGHVSQNVGDGWQWEKLPNLWVGASVEDQATADERIPRLLDIPAAVRFLSCEPLLGFVDLFRPLPLPGSYDGRPIDWVIAGGESGPKARPCHPDWVRLLRDQCNESAIWFFFKQWGEWAPRSQLSNAARKDFWAHSDKPQKPWGIVAQYGHYAAQTTPWNGHDDDGTGGEAVVLRIGKQAAGRQLDGREWNEFPQSQEKSIG